MSADPRIIVERVVAYRVRVVPDSAVEPYASEAKEIFTTREAALACAKDAGKGWGFPVEDLTGEVGK